MLCVTCRPLKNGPYNQSSRHSELRSVGLKRNQGSNEKIRQLELDRETTGLSQYGNQNLPLLQVVLEHPQSGSGGSNWLR